MWVTDEALAQWDNLRSGSLQDLRRMVKHAAPVTHLKGNRRYKDFVFQVSNKKVLSVSLLNGRGDCDFCGGRGYTEIYDDFLERKMKLPCHVCG